MAITVTFVVFHVALSRLLDLDTRAQTANQLQHTVVPVLAVVGWLAFGPRGLTSGRVVVLAVVFPLLWVAFTMVRGPLASHWYPYPFVDVAALGYARVAANTLWVAVLFVGLAAAAAALDRRLPRRPELPAAAGASARPRCAARPAGRPRPAPRSRARR